MSAATTATRPQGLLADRRFQIEMALVIVGFVLLALAPLYLSDFRLNQMGKFLTFAIVAIGIDLLWGYTGMLSLGQGVFFGLGGYAMAMYLKLHASGDALPDFMGWSGLTALPWFWEPFRHAWFALPMVIIGPGIVAFVFGYVLFRSRVTGVYFSIVTQALALAQGVKLGGNAREIVIFRRAEDWRLIATRVDIKGAHLGKVPLPTDEIWLRDNDLIIVPPTPIQRFDNFVRQVFTEGMYGLFPISQVGSGLEIRTGIFNQ